MTQQQEQALRLYAQVYLIRRAEEKIREHYLEDEMKTPVHLYIGQEAIAAGVCDVLRPSDQVLGTYRSHGIYLARSDDPEGMFAELYGRVTGPGKGKAGSMHLARPDAGVLMTSAVVGTTIPVSLGCAYALKQQGADDLVAVFFGDGAMDEGVFWETLNLACLQRLPILFVCEDNGLAIHKRAEQRRGYRSVEAAIAAYPCDFTHSDSTDPEEIRSLALEATDKIRSGIGPAFLQLQCYRYVEHVGINEDREFQYAYRRQDEFDYWKGRDPVRCQRERLIKLGVAESTIQEMEMATNERLDHCVQSAEKADFPAPTELVKDVFK